MDIEEKSVSPDNTVSVPYFIHEGAMERMSQNNKRLLIALIVSLVVLFLNNLVWITFIHLEHTSRPAIETTVYETGN